MSKVEVFAIRFNSLEMMIARKNFLKLSETAEGLIGIHPDGRYTYALFKTPELAVKSFKVFKKEFFGCKLIENACYIDEKYLKETK